MQGNIECRSKPLTSHFAWRTQGGTFPGGILACELSSQTRKPVKSTCMMSDWSGKGKKVDASTSGRSSRTLLKLCLVLSCALISRLQSHFESVDRASCVSNASPPESAGHIAAVCLLHCSGLHVASGALRDLVVRGRVLVLVWSSTRRSFLFGKLSPSSNSSTFGCGPHPHIHLVFLHRSHVAAACARAGPGAYHWPLTLLSERHTTTTRTPPRSIRPLVRCPLAFALRLLSARASVKPSAPSTVTPPSRSDRTDSPPRRTSRLSQ